MWDPSAADNDGHGKFREWESNYEAFAISIAARGLYSLLLVVGVNLSDVRSGRARTLGLLQGIVDEEIAMQPHLNVQLRSEILH